VDVKKKLQVSLTFWFYAQKIGSILGNWSGSSMVTNDWNADQVCIGCGNLRLHSTKKDMRLKCGGLFIDKSCEDNWNNVLTILRLLARDEKHLAQLEDKLDG
jgi:hypothetical protein